MNKKAKLLKKESGITLVELLAAISILSVVILLAGSIHLFAQRHFINQTDSASRSNDLSYALSVMTTDIRKREMNNIRINDEKNEIYVKNPGENFKEEPTYHVVNNQLIKDGQVLAESVSRMEVELGGTYSLEVTLYSSGNNIPNKKYHTTIVGRGGYDETEVD